jgi:hypothetical protein
MTPAAEWLLDNFYVVEEQLREIRDDLPAGFHAEPVIQATEPLLQERTPQDVLAARLPPEEVAGALHIRQPVPTVLRHFTTPHDSLPAAAGRGTRLSRLALPRGHRINSRLPRSRDDGLYRSVYSTWLAGLFDDLSPSPRDKSNSGGESPEGLPRCRLGRFGCETHKRSRFGRGLSPHRRRIFTRRASGAWINVP